MRRRLVALALYAASTGVASAHELLPAYLELRQTGSETYDVLFKVPAGAESLRLALYPELARNLRESRGRRRARSWATP